MNKQLAKKIIATCVLVALVVAGTTFAARQGSDGTARDGTLQVVASYYPLYEFARHVGGDKVQVSSITPAGAEPHDYEPSAKALADAEKATVFIYNGSHLEPWSSEFVKEYKGIAIKASEGMPLLKAEGEEPGEGLVQDPHFWLDPVLAQRIVDAVRDGLTRADPANGAHYAQRAASYNAELVGLDEAYRAGLASCKLHRIVASHEAFSYVGKRYGFAVTPIAGLSPEAEPSAAQLASISTLVRNEGLTHVFFERLASQRLADTIATETGAQTLVLDPIEGISDADQKQGKDYLSVQRENLQNLRTALACQ